MKYSIVEGEKMEAFKGGKGLCVCCNSETIAKCGQKIMHHWSHISLNHCDRWWENETQWHREWKSHFPKAWQEVVHFDDDTNEKHIADVKTEKGVVIEFQNSPIPLDELLSREHFYKKMVWVVNGEKFAKNFYILNKLPNPKAEFMQDVSFSILKDLKKKENLKSVPFFRYSENPNFDKESFRLLSTENITEQIEQNYIGHHLFYWEKKRDVWENAKCDVFFDFGSDVLCKLVRYDSSGLLCVKKINKAYFIDRALGVLNS